MKIEFHEAMSLLGMFAIALTAGASMYAAVTTPEATQSAPMPSQKPEEFLIGYTQAEVKPHVEILRVDVDDSLWVRGKKVGVYPGLAKDFNPGGLQFKEPRNWAYRAIRETKATGEPQ